MTSARDRSVPARVFRLGEEPPEDYSAMSPEERLALVEVLSARMRSIAGIPFERLRRDLVRIRPLREE